MKASSFALINCVFTRRENVGYKRENQCLGGYMNKRRDEGIVSIK